MSPRSIVNAVETAGELAQLIATQRRLLERLHPCDGTRCQELLAHERTLLWLMDRLREETPAADARPQEFLGAARELADVLRFDVPSSHRGMKGVPITAAKRGFIRTQKPFLTEVMRPQFSFNRELLSVIEQLVARQRAGSSVDLSSWVDRRLRTLVDPTAWHVRSPRASLSAKAIETVKQGYLRAATPVLRGFLDAQRRWNELAASSLVALARPQLPDPAEATALIASLEALSDPLNGADTSSPLARASKPFWREVFRRQTAFNHEVALALAHLLQTHAPAGTPPSLKDYPNWCAQVEPPQIEHAARALAGLSTRPLISLAMPAYRTPEAVLRVCIDSVLAQQYTNWELCIADDGSNSPELTALLEAYARADSRIRFRRLPANVGIARATNAALEDCRGEYVGFIDHDDQLAPHALAEVALRFAAEPTLDWVYSDEDRMDPEGRRCNPFFKPDWSPELFRACNYICHFVVVRREIVTRVGGLREGFEGSQDYDFLLRLSEYSTQVGHIPRILYHWRNSPLSFSYSKVQEASRAGRRALAEHLARLGEPAEAVDLEDTSYRVKYHVRGTPLVSLIVPFKDKPELLETLVGSLLAKTSYAHFELLLVSNQSSRPETFALLERLTDPRIRKLRWDEPFNYPAINNFAARQARGELLLFLNNDMEVTESGWLEELIAHAQRPEVGAVAPKLLFPDGSLQHAGVVVGLTGFAGHPFWRLPDNGSWTPFGHANWPRNYLAVTSACMMVRRELFEQVGGYDESFRVCGSDVELCLRMVEQGLRVVYTPYTRLTHHESASRRLETLPEDDFWNSFVAYRPYLRGGDPFYNPNLTLRATHCDLRWHPEDGQALALRTLAWELPGVRNRSLEETGRYQRHLAEHLPACDAAPRAVSAASVPHDGPPRRVQWLIPAADRLTPGLELVARMASLLRSKYRTDNRFVVYDAPWLSASKMEALLVMAGAEGQVQVLRDEEELARLPPCDVVIATHWTGAWLAQRHPTAALRTYLVQDFEARFHAAGTLYSLAERTYHLDLIGLFNSPGVHAFVTRHYPLAGPYFEPVADPAFLAPRPVSVSSGPRRLLCLADPLMPESGFETALLVLRRVKAELGSEVDILCVGQPFVPERFDAGGILRSVGALTAEETAALYRTCDVTLALSFTLHPTQQVLNAMASGVAVVINDNPAFRWLLEPERNCLVAEPTPSALTQQVLRCLREDPLRKRLAREARQRVSQSTWAEQVERLFSRLGDLGAARDGPRLSGKVAP